MEAYLRAVTRALEYMVVELSTTCNPAILDHTTCTVVLVFTSQRSYEPIAWPRSLILRSSSAVPDGDTAGMRPPVRLQEKPPRWDPAPSSMSPTTSPASLMS